MQRVEIAGLYQIRTKSQVRRALHHRALQTRPARKDERSEANFGTTTRHSPCTKLRLDTGSDITLLNVDEWKRLGSPKLKDTSIVVKDASGKQMKVHGELTCQFRLKGSTHGNPRF
ncbi:hypothetical protein Y032_0246g39 [Ancylostoma ceylanicum]|uniref:Peptidase A2 domain-containing protein n=1 Tax=Ancylostoma ceylanicum TaxID=53326 RepID=A0A016SCS6_9BILA|nr:hypothetical protein Y032_0246g39 [Ancylostoma ceylanicum]